MGVERFDSEAKQVLVQVQDIDSWLDRVSKDGSVNAVLVNEINNNKNAKRYFKLLVDWVNANPIILNKTYKGPSSQTLGGPTAPLGSGAPIYIPTNSQFDLSQLAGLFAANNMRAKISPHPLGANYGFVYGTRQP
ncbi:MAG: hypothetical protein Faunusvirus48_7, partial [Faunusvirus sp.]